MTTEIFRLPVTSSWVASPQFHTRPGRSCELVYEYEKEEESETTQLSLIFDGCWAVKITYFVAIDAELYLLTYDKVVDFGETDWLRKTKLNIAASRWETGQLRHLGISFDDGPLYEFICESFQTRTKAISTTKTEM